MKRAALVLACTAVPSACSGPPQQAATEGEQHCVRETRTGTHLPSTRCLTPAARAQEKRETQDFIDTLRKAPPKTSPTNNAGS
jgi:hypothetical protein